MLCAIMDLDSTEERNPSQTMNPGQNDMRVRNVFDEIGRSGLEVREGRSLEFPDLGLRAEAIWFSVPRFAQLYALSGVRAANVCQTVASKESDCPGLLCFRLTRVSHQNACGWWGSHNQRYHISSFLRPETPKDAVTFVVAARIPAVKRHA